MRSFLIYWTICCFYERPRELFSEKETPEVPFTIIRIGRAFTTPDLCCRYIDIITMFELRVSTSRKSLHTHPQENRTITANANRDFEFSAKSASRVCV